MGQYKVWEYLTRTGRSPFNDWLAALGDIRGRASIRARIDRLSLGNLGDHASIGDGIFELRVFHGPGYRIYFGFEGRRVILLLCGGDKKSQSRDISLAKEYWHDYRKRSNADK